MEGDPVKQRSHVVTKYWKLAAAALLSVALSAPLSASTAAAETPAPQRQATELQDQGATAGPVVDRGLEYLVSDYRTRTPAKYTADSWKPFAKALTAAAEVADDTSATTSDVADAKTALMTAAADLKAADEGTFQTITNNSFWNDTSGNPIYSQGGGVFKFGDTYYWYGVHYSGAELYRANPTRKYDGNVSFVSIPVYSSKDLVNWKFENRVATRSTTIQNGATLGQAGWVGRLGAAYNENTGKYVLATQAYVGGGHGVLFLQGDSPTDTFDHGYFQTQITNSPTTGTGDQTVFTDDDGKDYLIFSNREGRGRAFVSKLRESDSLRAEPGVQIGQNSSGREGNAMFKLDGKYYHAASDLHGWNSSVAHVLESTSSNIQGAYTSEYTLAGTEMDYSHVTQTGFFVTVKGTKQNTVIFMRRPLGRLRLERHRVQPVDAGDQDRREAAVPLGEPVAVQRHDRGVACRTGEQLPPQPRHPGRPRHRLQRSGMAEPRRFGDQRQRWCERVSLRPPGEQQRRRRAADRVGARRHLHPVPARSG